MVESSPEHEPAGRFAALANRFGLLEAVAGFLAGELLAAVLVAVLDAAVGRPSNFESNLCGLFGLWIGLVGAAVAASIGARRDRSRPGIVSLLAQDYGLRFKLLDAPLGIAVGLASTFLLVPLLELPLEPFVSHLNVRLGARALQLTAHVNGPGYVALALFVCVGSPVVEELFFRGLLLRGVLGRLQVLWGRGAAIGSLALCGVAFGLAHFDAIELLALSGFGVVLGLLALSTQRLGAGIFAHATFNAVTIISLAHTH